MLDYMREYEKWLHSGALTEDEVRKLAAKTEPAAVIADTASEAAVFRRETIRRIATTDSRAEVTVTPSE